MQQAAKEIKKEWRKDMRTEPQGSRARKWDPEGRKEEGRPISDEREAEVEAGDPRERTEKASNPLF